jgi:hypothetical protein
MRTAPFFLHKKNVSGVIPFIAADDLSSPKTSRPSLRVRIEETALLSFKHPSSATYQTEISTQRFTDYRQQFLQTPRPPISGEPS